jgi:uncharacterized protein YbjT (DUF2867 family)
MDLIVGATGLLGSEICRHLRASGKAVRALVRPTANLTKLEKLRSLGCTLFQGDLKDRSSLEAACRSMTAVVSTASSTISRQAGDSIQSVDLEGQIQLIDAARAAGIGHFVFISFPNLPSLDFPLQIAKHTVERHLIESGLTYTILQPTFFMEVWLSPALGFDVANAKAQIYGEGQNKISWISFEDVAQFAAMSLTMPEARNAVIELGGPEALSPLEVVQIFEELSGKRFQVQQHPEEALQSQKSGTSDPLQESFAALMLYYSRGDVIDMKLTLQNFPLALTSVKAYAKRILAIGSKGATIQAT